MGCIIENTVTPSIRRRVGQDYHVSWPVEVVGEDIALKDCDLTLEVVNPWQEKSYPSFSISEDGSSIEFDLPGTEYNVVGNYTFVIWRNFRKEGQSVCDVFEAITLVNHTYEECGEPDEDDISIESIKLESGRIYIGYKGDKGDPFTFDDFTAEQLEQIRGPKGDPLKFEDLTPEQIDEIIGPQGEAGVGVGNFEQIFKSNADGGANIYQLTLTDGKKFQIVINNGSRGSQGKSLTYDDLSDDEKEDLANRNLPEVKVMVAEEVEKLGDLKDILTVVPRIKALEDNDAEIQSKVSTLESGKADKTDIPDVSEFITKNVSDLLNYYTKSNTYTKLEVNTLLDSVKQFTYESVSVLPAASEETMNRIFLVPSGEGKNDNVKEEFITIQENGAYKWEQIGSTAIDLSGYVSLEALEEKLAAYALSTDVIEAIKDFVTNASLTTILNSYTTSEWVKANAVLHTDNTVSVLGIDKTVSKLSTPIVYVSSGLIMGGTAASAGLVTRGICGVITPSENGGCTKENLYINYDSTNKYSSNRQLVIQAGAVGTHYGNNLYQYCAARGDAVKGYSDSHYAALSHTHSLSDVSIIEATEEEIDALFQ